MAYTLYQMQDSGNCYKLRLAMAQLGVEFAIEDIDMLGGETRSQRYLAINPNGKVPVLKLEDGRVITESNAALWYLARGSALMPADDFDQAKALQWMFFEQYSHEPYIAVLRYWHHVVQRPEDIADREADLRARGYQALGAMDQHFARHDVFAGGAYSIADIALYAYTHVAHQGLFDLSDYGNVRAWLERVAGQAGHVDIAWRP
jgi:glutathione S-transferase